ncbi:MAG: xylulokinase [Armatimonadota bacterium]
MPSLVGIDVGTTGAKTILINTDGEVLASATVEYPLYTPKPLWAEQDPRDWWEATVESIQIVLRDSGIAPQDVKGVGLSGQMHGSVFLDEKDEVIRPAILWCDQRTADQCDWITEQVGEELLHEETLNPVLTGFQAPKIIWLRQNEAENYGKLRKVLLPKDYVRLLLTGEYATEVSDASGTSLLNVKERRWSDAVLEKIELPKEWLPEVYESPEISGKLTARAAELTGLPEGTPVAGGGGDQAAGGVGNGIVGPGIISSTTGTSGVVFAYLDEPLVDSELRTHTFCHAVPGKWHTMGVMLSAGGSLRWARDTLCDSERSVAELMDRDPYEIMTAEAEQAPVGCEGLVFLPYLSGERTPYPNPNARGVFFGLTLRCDRAYLIRSILEGVAFGLRDSFRIIEGMGAEIKEVRASGGGARSALWRQIQADVTGHAHVRIMPDEGGALGVALLAGVGTGIWSTVPQACEAVIKVVETTEPIAENVERYNSFYPIYQGLYESVKEHYDEVAGLME